MDKSSAERELEARLAELRAEQARIAASIEDALAGLRVVRGQSTADLPMTERVVQLLRHSGSALSRTQIARALDVPPSQRNNLSRTLNYLSKEQGRIVRSADGVGWLEAGIE